MLVGNPVHVYSLVTRLTTTLGYLRREMSSVPQVSGLERGITTILRHGDWPDSADIEGVTQAVARVMFTYNLDPLDMSRGLIHGHQTSARLSAADMFNIAYTRSTGHHPLRPGLGPEFALSIQWAEAARTRLEMSEDGEKNNHLLETINKFLAQTRHDHDQHWQSPDTNPGNLPNEEYFIEKIGDSGRSGREMRLLEADMIEDDLDHVKPGYYIREFNALCRGEQLQRKNQSSYAGKICVLTSNGDMYHLLSPYKLEIVSLDPVLFMYHDVLSDQEMQLMKSQAGSQLVISAMQDTTGGSGAGAKVTNERTQSNAWLWDHLEPVMHRLSLKTGSLARLETAQKQLNLVPGQPVPVIEAEAWQVGIYGPGGHYLPHYDTFDFDLPDPTSYTDQGQWVGNRMATVMYYLSDVVGGSTAFPRLGEATRATRGAAVFWFNLADDGGREDLSLHGACPTALGIKWVSNKWIREGAQIWTRPCEARHNVNNTCDSVICEENFKINNNINQTRFHL